ncbi:MAG: ATP-binding protein [Candidatus Cloacimonadaceae bacterium]|nr:ATP-binding protein [Candidatus Cloacimonadaceae bacterium]
MIEEKPSSSGIFCGLSETEVNNFAKDLKRIWYLKGDPIIMENTEGNNFYYICRGKVEINKGLDNAETPFAQLSVLYPGDFFGEMSIINDEPRSATAIALEDVELLEIPRDIFVNISFTHPIVMFNLIRTISCRLRDTNDKFVELMNQMISKNRLMAIGMAASKIIHDIKTPLTVTVLTAQLIESMYPESKEFTDSIIKQSKMVDQMVREILDFAKGTETPPLVQKVDMDMYFKELKETYGTSLKGRQIDFIIENKVKELVHFDEGKIRRVILNLLKNSSEALTETGEIKIIASLSSNWLQISLIDNGPGIPEPIQADLFKPFITLGKSHGTGLGLAICKKLVQEHRGRLEYIPVQPHGSRFDIRIPQNVK